MKKTKNKIWGIGLAVVLAVTCFVLPTNAEEIVDETVTEIEFTDLDKNPYQEYNGVNRAGEEYKVVIEEIPGKIRASTSTWKISYTSGVVNCHFYMNVSANQCTKVYDKSIMCIGCTYSNASLYHGTSYGKLAFNVSSYLNIVNFTGWLKGTCTGSANDVKVTWNF
ncbi:MAG: DUF5626 family protein [Hespellia sp.]|nr:DUF5626 family protein [Hespellia sp.]